MNLYLPTTPNAREVSQEVRSRREIGAGRNSSGVGEQMFAAHTPRSIYGQSLRRGTGHSSRFPFPVVASALPSGDRANPNHLGPASYDPSFRPVRTSRTTT